MPDTGYLLAAVTISAAVTWALRALPSSALAPLPRAGPFSTSAPVCLPVSW